MSPVRPRWDSDVLGRGVANGTPHAPEVRRLLGAMAESDWVAEDPDAHLLRGLRRRCTEPGSPWTLRSAQLDGAVYEVALEWARADARIGQLRADAFALIGAVAESSTHVRQCVVGAEIQYEVTTGMLTGDAGFGGHGHLMRLIIRGEAASTNAASMARPTP
ncbi:MAG: hypothetical protein M3506_07385 [Chloroflexota bacterium]|nr:hypothetical protein [Chloroflexota bacterium]